MNHEQPASMFGGGGGSHLEFIKASSSLTFDGKIINEANLSHTIDKQQMNPIQLNALPIGQPNLGQDKSELMKRTIKKFFIFI